MIGTVDAKESEIEREKPCGRRAIGSGCDTGSGIAIVVVDDISPAFAEEGDFEGFAVEIAVVVDVDDVPRGVSFGDGRMGVRIVLGDTRGEVADADGSD